MRPEPRRTIGSFDYLQNMATSISRGRPQYHSRPHEIRPLPRAELEGAGAWPLAALFLEWQASCLRRKKRAGARPNHVLPMS